MKLKIKLSKCIDCNKNVSRKDAIRCRSCNDLFQIGKNNPNWKGGKPSCLNCHKKLSNYDHKRCSKCIKKYQVGKNAGNWKGVSYNCQDCGKKLANIYAKRCQSCAKSGKLNYRFGKLIFHTKRIYYDNNTFRSLWEANFAKWLNLSKIKWKYESKTFDLGDTTYTPDFYLPQFDCHIEIKGFWYRENLKKFRKFKRIYKNINIKVFEKNQLKNMSIINK